MARSNVVCLSLFGDFEKQERSISRKTRKQYQTRINIFETNFNTSIKLFTTVFRRYIQNESNPGSLFPLIVTFPRLASSMKSMFNLTLAGYYYDANILERAFLESLGTCIYLARNESEADRWLSGKRIKSSSIKMLNEVFSILRRWEDFDLVAKMYGELNDYVHTNARAVRWHFIRQTDDIHDSLPIRNELSENYFEDSFCFLNPILLNLTMVVLFDGQLDLELKVRVIDEMGEFIKHDMALRHKGNQGVLKRQGALVPDVVDSESVGAHGAEHKISP